MSKETTHPAPPSNSIKHILTLAAEVYTKYKEHYRKIKSRLTETEKLRKTSLTLLKKKLPEQTVFVMEMIEESVFQSSSSRDVKNECVMQTPKYKSQIQKIVTKLLFRKQVRDELKDCKSQRSVNEILKSLR